MVLQARLLAWRLRKRLPHLAARAHEEHGKATLSPAWSLALVTKDDRASRRRIRGIPPTVSDPAAEKAWAGGGTIGRDALSIAQKPPGSMR